MKEKYKRICNKLGFKPSEYFCPKFDTEDDTFINPFSVLTSEEIDFLYENDLLTHDLKE